MSYDERRAVFAIESMIEWQNPTNILLSEINTWVSFLLAVKLLFYINTLEL